MEVVVEQIKQILKELEEVNKRVGFKPRKLDVSPEGFIILDPHNASDMEWQIMM